MTDKAAMMLVWELSRGEYRPFREMLRIAGSNGFTVADSGFLDPDVHRQAVSLLREWADALERVEDPGKP